MTYTSEVCEEETKLAVTVSREHVLVPKVEFAEHGTKGSSAINRTTNQWLRGERLVLRPTYDPLSARTFKYQANDAWLPIACAPSSWAQRDSIKVGAIVPTHSIMNKRPWVS